MIEVDDVWVEFTRRYHREPSLKDFVLSSFSGKGQIKKFWALQGIRFRLERGSMMAVIGTNGSGKSTLLKVIGGLLRPDRGAARVTGRVAPLLELGVGFEPALSGAENIFFNGAILKMSRQEIKSKFDSIVEFAELGEVIDTPLIHYSTGMSMRLGFAIAAHSPADVLLIDEILSVGDSSFQKKCLDKIFERNASGVSILFVSHSIDQVKALCKTALWIHKGEQRELGDSHEIAEKYLLFTDEDYRKRKEAADKSAAETLARKARDLAIGHLSFLDERGQPATRFRTFGPMTVCLEYHAKIPVHAPIVGMAIHHADGTHICGPNTQECNFPIEKLQDKGEIRLTIPSLNMAPGDYVFSVAVWDHTHTLAYDWGEKAWSFAVESPSCYKHRGHVAMEYQWKLNP